MADVFISYSRDDFATADDLQKILQESGWTVWIDPQLRAGDNFRDEIKAELRKARAVVVVWSDSSVKKPWVIAEAAESTARLPPAYLPVRISDAELPLPFGVYHTVDLRDSRYGEVGRGCEVLLKELQDRLGAPNAEQVDADALAHRRLKRRLREARTAIGIGLATALVALLLHGLGGFDGIYQGTEHWRRLTHQVRALFGNFERSDALRVVLVDQKTEERLGQKPLPDQASTEEPIGDFGPLWRWYHGDALRALTDAGARSVGYDVAFAPRGGPAEGRLARGTEHFAQAIRYARAHGTAVTITATSRDSRGAFVTDDTLLDALTSPLPADSGRHTGKGRVTLPCVAKNDGVALIFPLLLLSPKEALKEHSLALSTIEGLLGQEVAGPPRQGNLELATLGGVTQLPVAGRGAILKEASQGCPSMPRDSVPVQYLLPALPRSVARGAPGVVPFEDVLGGRGLDDVRGKAVLIGAQLGKDQHSVVACSGPLHCARQTLPGLALHAAAVDGMLSGRDLKPLGLLAQLVWFFALAVMMTYVRQLTAPRTRLIQIGAIALLVLCDLLCTLWLAVALDVASDALYHGASILLPLAAFEYLARRHKAGLGVQVDLSPAGAGATGDGAAS